MILSHRLMRTNLYDPPEPRVTIGYLMTESHRVHLDNLLQACMKLSGWADLNTSVSAGFL